MLVTDKNFHIPLFDESFKPEEATKMIEADINQKINNYKIEYLSKWVRNHSTDRSIYDQKIQALKEQKEDLKAMIDEAHKTNKKLSMDSVSETKSAD